MEKIIHLMTQDNQPYGSQRKCCEKCGVDAFNHSLTWHETNLFTDSSEMYDKPDVFLEKYTRCIDKPDVLSQWLIDNDIQTALIIYRDSTTLILFNEEKRIVSPVINLPIMSPTLHYEVHDSPHLYVHLKTTK